jgi:hypothetical protein
MPLAPVKNLEDIFHWALENAISIAGIDLIQQDEYS